MATPQKSSEAKGMACFVFERHHSSILSKSMTSPYTVVSICQILYSKRCVDESVLDGVELADTPLEDKKRALMGAIEKAVSDDHRKLHELATVLDQFKETKSVAKSILNNYDADQIKLQNVAKEAVLKNTSKLIDAITGCSFQGFVIGCAEKSLITPYHRNHLLHDTPINKEALLIGEIEKVVHFRPSCLDTVLCILIDKCGIPGTVVAKAVANDYDHMLPNYEKIKPTIGTVGGATSVICTDDYVEEMVSQSDQMSNEDRASDILRTHYGTLSQSLKDPVNIARLLHGENVISENAVTQVEAADILFNQTAVLLGLVRAAIRGNYQNLKKFGRVLGELAAGPGNQRDGLALLKDYNKTFPTENFSIPVLQSNTLAEATDDVRHDITRDMEEEFSAIRGEFAGTLRKIQKTLSKHQVPVNDVKSFCKFAYPKCFQEIDDCQTMEDVLTFVAKKCTLINISILRKLLDDCEIDEAKQHIQDYQQAVDDFSQNMRARFPLNQSLLPDGTPHPLCGETITFVMKWHSEIVSLDDIEDLQTYAFGKYGQHVKVIVIKETNSIMITCSFPFELTSLLMAEAMKNLKLLKKNGLLKLTIGYYTIWNIRDEGETDELNEFNEKVMNEETDVEETSDISDQQSGSDTESIVELSVVEQTDEAIQELQHQYQTFPSQTKSPPFLSDSSSVEISQEKEEKTMMLSLSDQLTESEEKNLNKQLSTDIKGTESELMGQADETEMLKQQIKAMIMENKTLKSQLKIMQEIMIEAMREKEVLKKEKDQIIKEKTSFIEMLEEKEGKILSLHKREEEEKNKINTSKATQTPHKNSKSLLLVKKVSPSKYDSGRKRRVKWDMPISGSVILTSPTPSDCITVIHKISIDKMPCKRIALHSSSTNSTTLLLSLLDQTNVKILSICNTQLTIANLQCVYHLININQLQYLWLNNTFLSTTGGLHLLTDAISTNTSLGQLVIWDDRFTEDDMVNISQALTVNTTLQQLYLRNCNITDTGLMQLSNALTHNKTLKELGVSDNNLITSSTAVCDIILNSSLTHLYLHCTSLFSDSIPQLLDALSSKDNVQLLGIDERHAERCQKHNNYRDVQDRLYYYSVQ